jgi:hypothetical protein
MAKVDFLVCHPSSIETPNLVPNFWNPRHLTGIGYSIPSSISQTNVVPEKKQPQKNNKSKKMTPLKNYLVLDCP